VIINRYIRAKKAADAETQPVIAPPKAILPPKAAQQSKIAKKKKKK
jgi:hypothetical protein